MNFLRFFKRAKQEKIEPENIEEEITRKPSGTIVIDFFSDNGDFNVYSNIDDTSDEAVNVLSLLLYHMDAGELSSFVVQSLRLWADNDDEKIEFNAKTLLKMVEYDNLLIDVENKDESLEEVAVRASKVFNFREALK
jgi:hypothetical protein